MHVGTLHAWYTHPMRPCSDRCMLGTPPRVRPIRRQPLPPSFAVIANLLDRTVARDSPLRTVEPAGLIGANPSEAGWGRFAA